jgi:hypothetical protein
MFMLVQEIEYIYRGAFVIRGLFYQQIHLFTLTKMLKMTNMAFLTANSRFAVLNDETYPPRITRKTCIAGLKVFDTKVVRSGRK